MEKAKKSVTIIENKDEKVVKPVVSKDIVSESSDEGEPEQYGSNMQISNISGQISTYDYTDNPEEESELHKMLLSPEILDLLNEYFNELNDEDFLNEVNEVLDTFKHLSLENKILEMFLNNNEPTLLSTLPKARAMIQELQQTAPLLPDFFEVPEIPITPEMMLFSEGPRINISHVSDLLLRYVEEMQKSLDSFIAEAHKKRKKYKAEIEQCSIWISEIEEAIEIFEETVVQAVDPLTQRIPAEKFVWYMHDWLKSARLVTEKIRLRNASMKTQLNKLKALYVYKKEVGISLCDIDFEGLRIENDNHLKTIEQKNTHLIELKKITGAANLDLTTKKNYLFQLQVGIEDISAAIKAVSKQTVLNTEECTKAQKELELSKEAYEKVFNTVKSCRAPAILDYVRIKAEKHELEKELKVLCRQNNLIEVALKTFAKKMMNLHHTNHIKPEWLLTETADDIDVYLMETMLEPNSDDSSQEEPPACDIFEVLNISTKVESKEQEKELKEIMKPKRRTKRSTSMFHKSRENSPKT